VTSSSVPYGQNAEYHARARDEIARVSHRISTFRLIAFLIGTASLIWTMRGAAALPISITVVSFFAFAVLVVWHARVDDRVAWHEALRVVNMRGLARLARDWDRLPAADPPPGVDLSNHPFAVDLDLFGRASLCQWLGPTTTPRGRATLASWLLFPALKDEIIERQEAIARLASLDDWRASLSAYGVLVEKAREVEIARFVAWAEGEDPFVPRLGVLKAVVLTITGALWILIAAAATGAMEAQLWPIPLLIGIVVSFAYAYRITTTLDRAGGGEDALSRYASVFEHAVTVPRETRRLSDLLDRLSAGGVPAPRCMRQLNRILGFGELRRGAAILHFPIQALTLWDFYVIFALERWRQTSGTRVRAWLQALGELDALALLATARRDNPAWAVPEVQTIPQISAQAIGHPLIPDSRRVPNDVIVGSPGTLMLVTGSNMSGKSTLLRAIGLNIVLAQAGACVCARQMTLPESDLQTSIRVQDSLERGMSYFMAALARLKGVVDAAEHERGGRVLVYLLDEILQGTNSAERSIAVRAVARHLLKAGAIGAMTTHDLSLAEEEPLKTAAQCWHFSETLDERGAMHFDYKLKPGLATSRNALRLMQMIGIDL
jgi:MutS domain V